MRRNNYREANHRSKQNVPSEEKSAISESKIADPVPLTADSATPVQSASLPSDVTPSSSLSAAATTFSPSETNVETSAETPALSASIDEFAQTGGGEDDLFDDAGFSDDESMRVRDDDDLFNDDFTPAPASETVLHAETPLVPETTTVPIVRDATVGARDGPTSAQSRGNNRSRGRGGRGRASNATRNERSSTQQSANQSDQSIVQPASDPPENAPTGPKKESVPAVRGDRQATGGVKKPKLTEEELAEKMAQIQIKNASLVAAHARAEADAASFAERESQAKIDAAQRQKVERRDRQQMMGEREKNRMRKLKAMEGREWDAEKNEDDFSKGGRFDRKAGFVGDDADYTDGKEYLYREPRGGATPRGGRRGGRGGQADTPRAPPKQDEFPALPNAKTPVNLTGAISSWADQVENA